MTLSCAAPASSRSDLLRSVRVRAPGRLHLGFLDPAGSLGRRFGSLGLVVDGFETQVEVTASDELHVSVEAGSADVDATADLERARGHLNALRRQTGLQAPLHLHLLQALPAHAGLGSGTQLALAVGRAFAHWHGLPVGTASLSQWLGRGVRSGIGIAGFDQGGLLLDGGPGDAAGHVPSAAPLLARLPFPDAWRVLVVLDAGCRGLSGPAEKHAIATLPPLPQAASADICHQVLMRVLPGAASADFAPFAAGITRLQQILGEHFAPAQGGSVYTSASVGRLLRWIADAAGRIAPGVTAGIGQSSWGPTGFAIFASQVHAEAVLAAARAARVVEPGLSVHIVRGRNQGATLFDTCLPLPPT